MSLTDNTLFIFGVFIFVMFMGSYAGQINSTLIGIDMTQAGSNQVSLLRISFYSIGLGWLYYGVKE